MASYHHLIHPSIKAVTTPAKVFAKLKSNVLRETHEKVKDEGKHGSNFYSPRRISDEFKENQRRESIHGEVNALTLSPIRSPQKGLGFLCSEFNTRAVEELPYLSETGKTFVTPKIGRTPVKTAILESTTLSYQSSTDISTQQPVIRVPDGFNAQTRPPEMNCSYRSNEVKQESPAHTRRKLEAQELSEVNDRVEGGKCHPKKMKSIQDNTFTCPTPSQTIFAIPAQLTKPRVEVSLERFPLMSPAKVFAYMKEREKKREQTEGLQVRNRTTKQSEDVDHLCQSRHGPDLTVSQPDGTEDVHSRDTPEHLPSASATTVESSDNQSHIHPSDSQSPSALSSQPVWFEDPFVLHSPLVSIPKKLDKMVKRNKWFQHGEFPSESVIYLKKWFLRWSQKGLFVNGIYGEDNIPWNSNIITERVSTSVLKTVSGRVYILVGKMNLSVKSEFPKWFLKKFAKGFPPDWKTLYEMFLSKEKSKTMGERKRQSKKKTETSTTNRCVKPHRTNPLKTIDSCNYSTTESETKRSRCGRLIKPPLEYWKGGRVILDSRMNVSVYESYNTSISTSHVTATVTKKSSRKPSHRILPWTDSNESCESTGDTEPSTVLRKVKPPLRKQKNISGNLVEKPSSPPEPPEPPEAVTHHNNIPKNVSDRETRSRYKSQRTFYVDSASKKQTETEKHLTRTSKKQTEDTNGVTRKSRWAVLTDSSFKGKKRRNTKKRANPLSITQPSFVSSLSQSDSSDNDVKDGSKRSEQRVRKNPKVDRETDKKQSKHTKTSTSPEYLVKFTQGRSRGKRNILTEEEDDKWTEEELLKLKEAVSFYPKHVGSYWTKVSRMVGTRSAEECHNQQTSMRSFKTPPKKDKSKRKKVEPPKETAAQFPIISAGVGTLKRKQQVRNFLESMPKENVDDVFSSETMQGKRFEMPSMCPSEEDDFTVPDMELRTPMPMGFPEAKTPQCLHITPGMMGSPSRTHDDKYVYQLQKKMKNKYFNVHAHASKNLIPTPSVKRTMKRCDNLENSLVVWEMFPDKEDLLSESGEDDFYFSNDD